MPKLIKEWYKGEIREVSVPDLINTEIIRCTPWQLRKALNQLSLRDAVENAVASADQTTKDGWEFATEFRRDDPLVISMGLALGKTEDELDDLFQLARTL
jgi:hypothetical protein